MAGYFQFIFVILVFQAAIISSKFHGNYQKSSPTDTNKPWPAMKLDTGKTQNRIVAATQKLKASPVTLELYYETLCQGCLEMIFEIIFPVWKSMAKSGRNNIYILVIFAEIHMVFLI